MVPVDKLLYLKNVFHLKWIKAFDKESQDVKASSIGRKKPIHVTLDIFFRDNTVCQDVNLKFSTSL